MICRRLLCDLSSTAVSSAQDKDGVVAAAVFAEMAGELARRGSTVTGHLDFLFRHYGYFLTNNRYVFVDDPRKTVAIFTRLRNEGMWSGGGYPFWPVLAACVVVDLHYLTRRRYVRRGVC